MTHAPSPPLHIVNNLSSWYNETPRYREYFSARIFFFFGWNEFQEDSHRGNKDVLRTREINFHSFSGTKRGGN